MQEFRRSVTARAAIMIPVELLRRGFLYKAISRIEFPKNADSSKMADIDDSNTTKPTFLGGKDIIHLSKEKT